MKIFLILTLLSVCVALLGCAILEKASIVQRGVDEDGNEVWVLTDTGAAIINSGSGVAGNILGIPGEYIGAGIYALLGWAGIQTGRKGASLVKTKLNGATNGKKK